MNGFALLCGSAPKGFRQRKIEDMYDFLTGGAGGRYEPENIIVFPNGTNELFLENLLNASFDKASEEDEGNVLLYLCTREETDLSAELSDCAVPGVEAVRLGEDEVRKEVIAYYAGLAEKMGLGFRVEYGVDGDFLPEEELGYEKVSGGKNLC